MSVEHSPLGKPTRYPGQHDAALLFPIDRAGGRTALGLDPERLPFSGCDTWNAWELGWLDLRGKPRVALAEFRVPAASPRLIESKSFKLYLNSFAQSRFSASDEVRALLLRDLSAAAGAPVAVVLASVAGSEHAVQALEGECIDDLPVEVARYGPPDPGLLSVEDERVVSETLVSHLFRSNCPVTGQPDWASLQLRYSGPRLDRAGLLRYLVSFREHCGFHEQCVEQIFLDLWQHCRPARLSVHGRFTRRGGLDINPFRSSVAGESPGNPRTVRQ